jgi:glyoxylase-like metal-dependent hydrolase (beta-lactamase superfamily II)
MFGVVPRPFWSLVCPPDEKNRITLSTRSLVLRTDDRLILIDTGNGSKWSDKQRSIFMFEDAPTPPPFARDEVTDLILTHLHFDHGGGVSHYNEIGELALSYPNARHYLQKANYDTAKNPSLREKASYLKENVEILEHADLLLLEGTEEILPGITVHQVNGHTLGQQCVEVASDDAMLFYATDLVPTSHHLPVPYNMGYDICASTIMEEKERFLSYIHSKGGIIFFEHDPVVAAATITVNSKGHFAVSEQIEFDE